MQAKQVGIRFCGGCNPRINRGRIAWLSCAAIAGESIDASAVAERELACQMISKVRGHFEQLEKSFSR
jgi:hypothetical protein